MLTGVDVALSPYKVTVGSIPKWVGEGRMRENSERMTGGFWMR